MNSGKTMRIVSHRLVVEIFATDSEITLDVLPYSVKRHARAVEKFILYTSTFDVDAFTSSLSDDEEYWLYVDRILRFVEDFDDIKIHKNCVPRQKVRDAIEISEAVCSSLENGHMLSTFTFKRDDLNTLIPEYERIRFDMRTFGEVTYLAYISCEALSLARKALAYEDLW